MEVDIKAELLLSYVIAKYNQKNFSKFRLLTSLPRFRELCAEGNIFGKMLSREKYIKDFHQVVISRSSTGLSNVCVGAVRRPYQDDIFGSVTRFYSDLLYKHFPKCKRYTPSPVIQLGHGVNVKQVMSTVELTNIITLVVEPLKTHGDFKAVCGKILAAADSDEPGDQYDLFESISELYTLLRHADLESLPIEATETAEFVTAAELPEFFAGDCPKSYTASKPIGEAMVSVLTAYYKTGRLSEDKKTFLISVKNPFCYISSGPVPLPNFEPEQTGPIEDGKVQQQVGTAETPAATVTVDNQDDDFVAASNHVIQYYHSDFNSMPPSLREVVGFGNKEGAALHERIPKARINAYMKGFSYETYTLRDWFEHAYKTLQPWCSERKVVYMYAAGRLVAQKAQVTVNLISDPPTVQKR